MTTRTVIRQPVTRVAVRETTKIQTVTRNIGPPGQDGAGAVDSVFGRTGAVVAANNDYALAQINGLTDSGDGSQFLSNDGSYKAVQAGGSSESVFYCGTFAWRSFDLTSFCYIGEFKTNSTSPFITDSIRIGTISHEGFLIERLLNLSAGDRLHITGGIVSTLVELTEAPTVAEDIRYDNLSIITPSGGSWVGPYQVYAIKRS